MVEGVVGGRGRNRRVGVDGDVRFRGGFGLESVDDFVKFTRRLIVGSVQDRIIHGIVDGRIGHG